MKRSCVGLALFFVLVLWTCASDTAALELVPPPPGDILLPRDHRVVLYLDCGTGEDSVTADGLSITQDSGQAYAFPNISGPEGTAVYDADRVAFEIAGLRPDGEYVLGFTWWDADDSGRLQSVAFAPGAGGDWQTVLPPARVAAFNADKSVPARVTLPLTAPFIREEVLRVAFVKNGGPNAVVNAIWLLERSVSEPVKRVLIVTGDDYPGHDWRSTAPALAKALREVKGLEVSYTECPAMFGSPLLTHYDAAVIHFKNYDERLPLGPECENGLKDYVASGRGLALCHFSCGAFQKWDGFKAVAGRVWNPALRGHDPYGVFTVRIADPEHPAVSGMAAFDVKDELYTCLDGDTPIHVLCEATSVVDQRLYPIAFTVENTGGRVFHCVLGHDASVYENPRARALYQQGIAWTAGLIEN